MSAFAPLSLHPASLPHEPMNILKARKPQKVAAVSKLLLGHIKYNCTVKRNRLTRQLQLVAPPMRPSLQLNISIINPNVNACTSQQTAPMSMHARRKKLLFVALTGITAWPPTPQPPTPSRLHHNGCCTSCAMQRCSRAAAAAAAAAAMKAAAVLEAAVLVAAAVGKTAAYGRAHPNPQQLQHHRGSSPLRSL